MTRLDTRVLGYARTDLDISVHQLWLSYYSLGGSAGESDLEAFLDGSLAVSAGQYDVIAHALNERFTDRGENHPVPYSDDVEVAT